MSFYDKHRKIGRIVCVFRGHLGSHTRLVREDNEYAHYVNGCCRCSVKDIEFKIRQDDPDREQILTSLPIHRHGGYYGIADGLTNPKRTWKWTDGAGWEVIQPTTSKDTDGRKVLWAGTKWLSNQGVTVEEFNEVWSRSRRQGGLNEREKG